MIKRKTKMQHMLLMGEMADEEHVEELVDAPKESGEDAIHPAEDGGLAETPTVSADGSFPEAVRSLPQTLSCSSGCGRTARSVAASPLGLDLALVSCGF